MAVYLKMQLAMADRCSLGQVCSKQLIGGLRCWQENGNAAAVWPLSALLLDRALPSECQMLLFSATFEDSVWQFAERIIPDPNVIKLRKEELTLNNIRQYYVLCENRKEKYQALCNIYGGITIGQAIIFCQVIPAECVLMFPCTGTVTINAILWSRVFSPFHVLTSLINRTALKWDCLYFVGETWKVSVMEWGLQCDMK